VLRRRKGVRGGVIQCREAVASSQCGNDGDGLSPSDVGGTDGLDDILEERSGAEQPAELLPGSVAMSGNPAALAVERSQVLVKADHPSDGVCNDCLPSRGKTRQARNTDEETVFGRLGQLAYDGLGVVERKGGAEGLSVGQPVVGSEHEVAVRTHGGGKVEVPAGGEVESHAGFSATRRKS